MEDETKKGAQDPAKASAAGGGTTSQKPPKETYSRAEHEQEINKLSDKLAEGGRKLKALTEEATAKATALTAAETKISELNTQIEGFEDRMDDLARKGLGDSPEGVKALQELQAARKEHREIKKERDELEKDKLTHAAELKAAQETNFEITVWEIAEELKVDPVRLKESCLEFKLTTEEQIKKQAEFLAASGTSGEGTEGEKAGATAGLRIDSAKGAGGGEKSEEEGLKERYPTMFPK